jgi:hypothetical protein
LFVEGVVGPPYNFQSFLKGIKVMKVGRAGLNHRLEKVEDDFVELWNNMASLWGISPTMARIHGLLYITGGRRAFHGRHHGPPGDLARQRQHEPQQAR